MTHKPTNKNEWKNSLTFRIKAPEGTVWIQIIEEKVGVIEHIFMQVGKGGSALNAMCAGMAELATSNIRKGQSISELIVTLSEISADKYVKTDGMKVYTPVDALVIALMKYRSSIPEELEKESLSKHLERNNRKLRV